MRTFLNKPWSNHIGEHNCIPESSYLPTSIDDLVKIVQTAEKKNAKVKACGSGHSWSSVCFTNSRMVLPQSLSGLLELEEGLLMPNINKENLVRVQSGTTIRDLNTILDEMGKAFPKLGGFDGQTIVGACQTSTHGSVIGSGPLYEMIVSYDVVGSEGKLYRIEKTNGITDKNKFNKTYPDFTLIQDDKYYNAISVGLGCLGLIASVILEVVPAFILKEERHVSDWLSIKKELIKKDVFKSNFHYEILINPHPNTDKNHTCLVTKRNPYQLTGTESLEDKRRNVLVEFLSKLSSGGDPSTLFNLFKSKSDELINLIIKSMEDKAYIGKSHKVFHIGEANYIPSYSSELAFDMTDNYYILCLDKMLETIEKNRKDHKLYHSAPIALRFVRAADAFLSPMYGRDTCMAEVILAKGTKGAKKMLSSIEKSMYPYRSRMHWGQYNYLNKQKVIEMYPALDEWKSVSSVLNATGVFDNPFSNSVGLSNP